MSFRPLDDYEESSRPEKAAKKEPCRKCKVYISLRSPADAVCFACWAGHPTHTRPRFNPQSHPHYVATGLRKKSEAEHRAKRRFIHTVES